MTPVTGGFELGRGHVSHIVKMADFFFKNSSVLPGIQTESIVMVTKEGCTKIVNV